MGTIIGFKVLCKFVLTVFGLKTKGRYQDQDKTGQQQHSGHNCDNCDNSDKVGKA